MLGLTCPDVVDWLDGKAAEVPGDGAVKQAPDETYEDLTR